MGQFDIYISYSKMDNKPLQGAEGKGWVTFIQLFLQQILCQMLHREISFLSLSDQQRPTEFQKTKVLICIISPNFIDSSACVENLHLFSIGGNKKIFKLNKHFVPLEAQPLQIQLLPNYDFYKGNNIGDILSLEDFFNPYISKTLWIQLINLASDIAIALRDTNNASENRFYKGKTIYLSETSGNKQSEKLYIRRELEKQGYKVLPQKPYPANTKELEGFIKKHIEESNISIHLIDSSFYNHQINAASLIAELENKIAAEHSNWVLINNLQTIEKREFNRLVWISPELESNDERQRSFIENYMRNGESLDGVEILQVPLEDFKFIIKKALLDRPEETNREKTFSNQVYILYDQIDQTEGELLEDFFNTYGYNVLKPIFKGDLTSVRRHHLNNLKCCDIAVIYHGKVNNQWLRVKFLDVLKCPGLGRKKPLLGKAICTRSKEVLESDFYKEYDFELLDNSKALKSEVFDPFLNKIREEAYG